MSAMADTVGAMRSPVSLDERQTAVVATPSGESTVVIGGPGSGKTTTLVERVAALTSQEGWGPDNVLVLAGNRAVAATLRDELALAIGRTSSGPIARTAASVAFQIVQTHLGRPVTLLTGAEHDALIAELLSGEIADDLDAYWPPHLGRELRQLRGFRTELREFLMRCEEHGIRAEDLRAYAIELERPEWAAVAEFRDRAVAPQAAAHPDQFDSAELVAFAARLLSDGVPQTGFADVRVVLIDDAQDATESTISLLRAWASRGVAVNAFGDPDVASNGFRGGNADVLGNFDSVLGLTEVRRHVLNGRYRGTDTLRIEYARVVQAIGTRGVSGHREVLVPGAPSVEGPDWSRVIAPSPFTEARVIAEQLRTRHVLDGVPWSELAVITRSSRQAQALETSLGRLGVPTSRTVSRQLLREDTGARWLLTAAQFAYQTSAVGDPSPERFDAFLQILGGPLGQCDPIAIRRLRRQLRDANVTLADGIEAPVQFSLLGTREGERAAAVSSALQQATRLTTSGSIEDVLWLLWESSPVARQWIEQSQGTGALADDANAALDGVVAVFAAAKRFVERRPTESGAVFLGEQFDADVPEDLIVSGRTGGAITVATPAQLVGRSFDTVVIAGLVDGVWPNLRPRFSLLHADALVARATGHELPSDPAGERASVRSDEYRLFALALSRASSRVVLSAYRGEDARVSVLFGDDTHLPETPRTATRLRDVAATARRQLVRAIERGSDASMHAATLRRLAEAGVPGAHPDDWYGLRERSTDAPLVDLTAADTKLKVSPSNIEKLEESSLAWFVDAFAPAPASDAQATGIIVHEALETLGGSPGVTVDDFRAFVEPKLAQLPVEAEWMRAQTERTVRVMLERLCQYLEAAAAQGRELVGAETPFRLERGPIVVSGIIDRVERTAEGAYYVVDLKTGKTHKSGEEAAHSAQMECYQLAIHEGVVEGLDAGPAAGAALLYIRTTAQTPTVRPQSALTDAAAEAVWTRIERAANAMAGPSYTDFVDVSDRGPTAARRYRIQVIPGVCQ